MTTLQNLYISINPFDETLTYTCMYLGTFDERYSSSAYLDEVSVGESDSSFELDKQALIASDVYDTLQLQVRLIPLYYNHCFPSLP